VPHVVRRINNALTRADQIHHMEGKNDGIDFFAPIVADAEADYYGEPLLAKRLGADGQLELIGRSGKYRAYVVR
jgi:isocitrate lyase